ncbi:MAG: threonine synthase [bacterium]|nr:threonine synthase [Candidatus Sumerlaeota bacterium]
MMTRRIEFYSTNDPGRKQPPLDFADALMKGLAPDKGLYMADRDALPRLTPGDIEAFRSMSYSKIAHRVLMPFVEGRVPADIFRGICEDAYDYEIPVENYAPGRHLLRLDRGPTASFKDFAARMMARLMRHFLREQGRRVTILTATSGDTGGAVASAFHSLDNVIVVVLFPGSEVSDRQRRQMTTLGGNVRAINVDAKFDDCQALVKHAFVDPDLASLDLSSANSINVGRLLPQSVYYFYAASRVPAGSPLWMCVPSGNFGNLMGGLLAKHMGLRVARFIAAVNENDEFPVYLRTTRYQPVVPSRNCLSNAMNVGHPSNLARLIALYGGAMNEEGKILKTPDLEAIRRDIVSADVTDTETREAIAGAWRDHHIIIEPHGAVGYKALDKLGVGDDCAAILLETAHPAKFPDVIRETIGIDPEPPPSMACQETAAEEQHECPNDYASFKPLLKSLTRS